MFNVDGEYDAYDNECPGQGGPVCEGQVGGMMVTDVDPETGERETEWVKEGRILSCPWCSWEFDLVTGQCESNERAALFGRDVRIEDGRIVVSKQG